MYGARIVRDWCTSARTWWKNAASSGMGCERSFRGRAWIMASMPRRDRAARPRPCQGTVGRPGAHAEAAGRAAGRPERHVPAQHPDDEDPAEIDVSHAMSRLDRHEVVGLDVGDQALEAPGLVGGEGARHADRMEP